MYLADRHRDVGRFADAATAYQEAVALDPSHAGAWGQLGNMLKDSGRPGDAIEAYRCALALCPDDANTFLQISRAQRLLGAHEEAVNTLNRALALAPALQRAAEELLALGERLPEATRRIGLEALQSITGAAEARRSPVTALASIPIESYDQFREMHPVVPPPGVGDGVSAIRRVGFVVAAESTSGDRTGSCVETILAQHGVAVETVLIVREGEGEEARAIGARGDPRVRVLEVGPSVTPVDVLRRGVEELVDVEFCVVLSEPLRLDPAAAAWLGWPIAQLGAVGSFCDEDEPQGAGDTRRPLLRGARDIEAFTHCEYPGAVLGMRRQVLLAALSSVAEQGGCASVESGLASLCLNLSPDAPIAHVPRILGSRLVPRISIGSSRPSAAPSPSESIEIVIPTRDRVELLAPCIDAFIKLAHDPDRVRIHVVDSGSQEPETTRYLAQAETAGRLRLTRLTGPFNWSRVNNAAAAKSEAGILLFSNNDIEILAPHWDTLLRQRLADTGTGAVGGLLLYADMTIQHAGIVLGHNNHTEHEGRHWPESAGGPDGRFLKSRTVSAVTGALMACRRETFQQVGGFDEADLPVWYNDIDFCLRLQELGYRVVYEPGLRALHYESVTLRTTHGNAEGRKLHHAATQLMSDRWGRAFRCDPYYNPQYGRVGRTFRYLCEPPLAAILEHVEASCDPRPVSIRPHGGAGPPSGDES